MDVPNLPSGNQTTRKFSDPDEPVTRLRVVKRNHLPARRSPTSATQTSGTSPRNIRRIKQEIDSNDLDLRIVMTKCCGLNPGTSQFLEAYVAGRIECLGQSRQHQTGIPHVTFMDEWNLAMPTFENPHTISLADTPKNPFIITHLGHLVRFFWPWIAVILPSQVYVSWAGSGWIAQYLDGERSFHAALIGLVFFVADSAIFFCNQGKHFNSFLKPGLVILMASMFSCVVLLLMNKVSNLM